jgi:hypothetical protein
MCEEGVGVGWKLMEILVNVWQMRVLLTGC